jgi:chromosome partitioning protein
MTCVKVLNAAHITAKKLFLPNYIDVRVKNPNEESIREMFRKAGSILPRIKQGVAIQRVSTLRPIDMYQQKAIMYTIEEILKAVNP